VERITLANRFVNYADAASVFPLVQVIAFSVALSEPDIRRSIADIWLACAFVVLSAYTAILDPLCRLS